MKAEDLKFNVEGEDEGQIWKNSDTNKIMFTDRHGKEYDISSFVVDRKLVEEALIEVIEILRASCLYNKNNEMDNAETAIGIMVDKARHAERYLKSALGKDKDCE